MIINYRYWSIITKCHPFIRLSTVGCSTLSLCDNNVYKSINVTICSGFRLPLSYWIFYLIPFISLSLYHSLSRVIDLAHCIMYISLNPRMFAERYTKQICTQDLNLAYSYLQKYYPTCVCLCIHTYMYCGKISFCDWKTQQVWKSGKNIMQGVKVLIILRNDNNMIVIFHQLSSVRIE